MARLQSLQELRTLQAPGRNFVTQFSLFAICSLKINLPKVIYMYIYLFGFIYPIRYRMALHERLWRGLWLPLLTEMSLSSDFRRRTFPENNGDHKKKSFSVEFKSDERRNLASQEVTWGLCDSITGHKATLIEKTYICVNSVIIIRK